MALAAEITKAGEHPQVVLEVTCGWYWAVDVLTDAGSSPTGTPNPPRGPAATPTSEKIAAARQLGRRCAARGTVVPRSLTESGCTS